MRRKLNKFDFSKKKAQLESPVGLYLQARIKDVKGKAVKVSGNRIKGMPDYDVYIPGAFFCKVETKRPEGGILSDIQATRQKWLVSCNIIVVNIKNKNEVDEFVNYLKSIIIG